MKDKVQKIREEVERRMKAASKIEEDYKDIDENVAKTAHLKAVEYHSMLMFIDSLQEEPVSKDFEEASKKWLIPQLDKSYAAYGETKQMELTHFDGYAMLDAIEFGAKWQEQQDQSTIELAEDHAMLAGMEKMKEEMMKEPNLSGYVARDEDGNLHIFEVEPRRLEEKHRWWDRDYHCHIIDNDAFPDLRWKDEPICVKLVIIKED